MSDVTIKVNYENVGAYLLKSEAVAATLETLATQAAQMAGLDASNIKTDTYSGVTRVNVGVGS